MLTTLYTPSSVPLTPFGAMAAEKRSFLDTIADYAGRIEGAVTGVRSGVDSLRTPTPPPTMRGSVLGIPNFNWNSPIVIAGLAIGVAMLLRK